MNLQLYDLDARYEALAELPLEDGQYAELDSLREAIAAIQDDASRKALSLAKVVKGLEAEAQLLEEHARDLQKKAQARRGRVAYLRHRIRLELEASGRDRARDALVTVWLQQSPPAVGVVDETKVPAEFMRAVLRLPYALVTSELRGHCSTWMSIEQVSSSWSDARANCQRACRSRMVNDTSEFTDTARPTGTEHLHMPCGERNAFVLRL